MTDTRITLEEPPIYDGVLKETGEYALNWQNWINSIHGKIRTHDFNVNNHIPLNPDFHWSRIHGETPIVGDGETVDKWFVKSNGNSFTLTPTFYTDNTYTSATGSAHYINLTIPSALIADFEIYQTLANEVSKFQNKDIVASVLLKNNTSVSADIKFYIGYDMDNSGTDDYWDETSAMKITQADSLVYVVIPTTQISTNNQNHTISMKLLFTESSAAIDFDLFFIKFELTDQFSGIYVDHTFEKLRIDNA